MCIENEMIFEIGLKLKWIPCGFLAELFGLNLPFLNLSHLENLSVSLSFSLSLYLQLTFDSIESIIARSRFLVFSIPQHKVYMFSVEVIIVVSYGPKLLPGCTICCICIFYPSLKQLQDMFSNLTDKTTKRVHNKIVSLRETGKLRVSELRSACHGHNECVFTGFFRKLKPLL